jgi:RNA methyltransferase, TrmH family
VQRLRRLIGRRSARQAEGVFVVEGAKGVEEALAGGAGIESVFVDVDAANPTERDLAGACARVGGRVLELQRGVLARVCDTVTPQPMAATVRMVDVSLASLAPHRLDLIVVCVDVRDPGNLGTILRSAGAAGAGAVVACAGSVDIYNPKTVRSSAGMLFHLPVVTGPDAGEVLDELGRWGLRRWGTAVKGGCDYAQVDLAGPVALVLGNESHGLGSSIATRLDAVVTIPMAGAAESLNVGTAAAVLCFEAARQRRSETEVTR